MGKIMVSKAAKAKSKKILLFLYFVTLLGVKIKTKLKVVWQKLNKKPILIYILNQ